MDLEAFVDPPLFCFFLCAVPESWLVTVHSADQIPNMDKQGPAWGINFTGAKSDGFVVVTARCKGASAPSGLTSPSGLCVNTN